MDRVVGSLKGIVARTASSAKNGVNLEAANLAKFSDGACTCSLGDTNVLVTVVSQHNAKSSSASFAPLSVNYKQKAAAAGRIPMTNLRRDIGFSENEILTSRMIDRSIRPAFFKGYNLETQVVCNLLAVDGSNDPDILAINGASASISISDIPWNGPIGAVRMGLVGESLIANPTRKQRENSRLNLVIAANDLGNVIMLDGSCQEPLLMNDIVKAIRHGIKECRHVIEAIVKLQKLSGKPKRVLELKNRPSEDQLAFVKKNAAEQIHDIFNDHRHDKTSRDDAIKEVMESISETFKEAFPESENTVLFNEAFTQIVRQTYRDLPRASGVRCDGRKFDQLRPITCRVDLYKPLHGSAIFQRGQTQVFCSTTFDSPDSAYRTDNMTLLMSGIKEKNFMLHYEFPPFATHDIGRVGTLPDRREVGHGALAEKSIRPLIPEGHEMTIRLSCEVLESNGSSSMASVCAGSLSLMDASVSLKEHVAGVSVGLISDLGDNDSIRKANNNTEIILTDILGFEDFIGDMDFKIAGTRKAITALQLDVKPTYGIPPTILYRALSKAHSAKDKIISIMDQAIKEPRKIKKANHPVMKSMFIPPHKKAKFIGLGGANLKKLIAQIGVRVTMLDEDMEVEPCQGTVKDNFLMFAPNNDAMQEAEEFIEALLEKDFKEPELDFNGIYTATIVEMRPNGVMVTLYPNMKPSLLPLSQLDIKPISHPSALNLSVGMQIQVKYFGRDPASGQMRLSRKSLQMSGVARTHSQVPT